MRKDFVLTDEERAFAEKHHEQVRWFLRKNNRAFDEWYDVVVFGYLNAVHAWFHKPVVQKWSFNTIASAFMKYAVMNQIQYHRRQKRTAVLLSMDAPINDEGTLSRHDIIPDDTGMEDSVLAGMAATSVTSQLNAREKQIFYQLAMGYRQSEIRSGLGLSRSKISRLVVTSRCRLRESLHPDMPR